MDTTAITAATASPTSKEGKAKQSLSSDLDTFLRLLTAQIENQDPLKPADGTEYASQLATFSGVEQSVRTNELLADMAAKLARQDMAVAANWIGMEVRHEGPVAVTGQPVALNLAIPPAADKAALVALDRDGVEVMRRPLDPRQKTLSWSGDDGRGGALPPVTYQVQVAASAGSQDLGLHPVSHYATVEEVTLGAGGAVLMLPGGVQLDMAQLDALRRPS